MDRTRPKNYFIDVAGPSEAGIIPATGSLAASISSAAGARPYFAGKPNPLVMHTVLDAIDAHSEESVMIGDKWTHITKGPETVLVLSGVAQREAVQRYFYSPTRVVESVAQIRP